MLPWSASARTEGHKRRTSDILQNPLPNTAIALVEKSGESVVNYKVVQYFHVTINYTATALKTEHTSSRQCPMHIPAKRHCLSQLNRSQSALNSGQKDHAVTNCWIAGVSMGNSKDKLPISPCTEVCWQWKKHPHLVSSFAEIFHCAV